MFIYIEKSFFWLLSLSISSFSVYLSMSSLIAAISSHQLNSIDEHRYHRSRQAHDVTMTNEDSSLSGTPRVSATHRSRPMPTSYSFWLNTGDNNNQTNASFMRSTYAASCRSRLSRSVERCPRACRGILADVFHLVITSVCAWASSYNLSACACLSIALLRSEPFFLYSQQFDNTLFSDI